MIFPRGLTHGSVENSKFDISLVLVKTGLELLFADVLGRNKGFPV